MSIYELHDFVSFTYEGTLVIGTIVQISDDGQNAEVAFLRDDVEESAWVRQDFLTKVSL